MKMKKIIARLFLVLACMFLSVMIKPEVCHAEVYKVIIDGETYYYRDGEEITEEEYWSEVVQDWWYSDFGILYVKDDGTIVWYGANQIFDSEIEAITYYVQVNNATGGTMLSDGSYVWYYEGEFLSKDEYVLKLASEYGSNCRVITSIEDGTKVYFYDGNAYYTLEEFYAGCGGFYTTSEEAAMAYIDKWFDQGCSEDEFFLGYQGDADILGYFNSRQDAIEYNATKSFREYQLKTEIFFDSDFDGALEIRAYLHLDNKEGIEESRKVAKSVADTLRGKSTYEQIKGAYDWLCNNIRYDHSLENHSVYSALIEKYTVCEGYAMAFQLIMEELGIESYIAVGPDHAWNAVRLDGQLYWVDATWGDQESYIWYQWFLFGTNYRANDTSLPIASSSYYTGLNDVPSGETPEIPSGSEIEGGNGSEEDSEDIEDSDTEEDIEDTETDGSTEEEETKDSVEEDVEDTESNDDVTDDKEQEEDEPLIDEADDKNDSGNHDKDNKFEKVAIIVTSICVVITGVIVICRLIKKKSE